MSEIEKKSEIVDDRFIEKLRLLSSSRIFIASSLLLATIIIHPGKENPDLFRAFLFVTICHLAVSIFFFSIEKIIKQRSLFWFSFIQIAWDIVFHTSMVYLTGGITSQYKFLYWLTIFFASILFLRPGALVAASLSSLFYALLIDLEYFESLPKLVNSFTHFSISTEKIVMSSIALNTLVFFFIAFGASAVTTRLSNAETEVLEKERRLKELEDKVTRSRHLASIGEMAARIAHEIRNPLTSVSASMEMLSNREEQGSNEKMILDIARRESRRLNQLLTDFLDYAKPSLPEFEKVFLSGLLEESIQLFRHGHPEVIIEINEYVANEIHLSADPKMLQQLFWNILKNASESMNAKGIIHIRFKNLQNIYYVIEVQDQGSGFDIKNHEKFFEPFYSSKQRGTGLGLSIAYRIMQDHFGSIELEPVEGSGTICRMMFPIRAGEGNRG